jgi:signal peptidase I
LVSSAVLQAIGDDVDLSSVDFALILFLLTLATGVLWCADRFYARPRRASDAASPLWVEWGATFFPVVLIVFGLRSFIVEPYKIPSGSMMPTLLVGDFIAVNKFTYGIRLPVIHTRIIDINTPKRGEVIVFRYPPDPSQSYIKRVVGLPGDKVDYVEKRLIINGEKVEVTDAGKYLSDRLYYSPKYTEKLGETEHDILIEQQPSILMPDSANYPFRENCTYSMHGFSCIVPEGHYWVMGDNRDHSADSRMWGFVPDENIVGRAFFIWFNFNDLGRIGRFR